MAVGVVAGVSLMMLPFAMVMALFLVVMKIMFHKAIGWFIPG
jgi:hypothetical protein